MLINQSFAFIRLFHFLFPLFYPLFWYDPSTFVSMDPDSIPISPIPENHENNESSDTGKAFNIYLKINDGDWVKYSDVVVDEDGDLNLHVVHRDIITPKTTIQDVSYSKTIKDTHKNIKIRDIRFGIKDNLPFLYIRKSGVSMEVVNDEYFDET